MYGCGGGNVFEPRTVVVMRKCFSQSVNAVRWMPSARSHPYGAKGMATRQTLARLSAHSVVVTFRSNILVVLDGPGAAGGIGRSDGGVPLRSQASAAMRAAPIRGAAALVTRDMPNLVAPSHYAMHAIPMPE